MQIFFMSLKVTRHNLEGHCLARLALFTGPIFVQSAADLESSLYSLSLPNAGSLPRTVLETRKNAQECFTV